MNPDLYAAARQQMVAAITAETIFACASIGKAALDERVMATLGKVPRHEFVPVELQPCQALRSFSICCDTVCHRGSGIAIASTVTNAAVALPLSSTMARAYRRSSTPKLFFGSSPADGVTSTFAAPTRSDRGAPRDVCASLGDDTARPSTIGRTADQRGMRRMCT